MASAEKRVLETGKLLPDGAQPMVSEDITGVETKSGLVPKGRNMILPLAVMVLLMPIAVRMGIIR